MLEVQIKTRRKRNCRNSTERGAQLAELAIVLPIFLLLLAGTAEFGNYFYTYSTLTKATRVAARYLSFRPFTAEEQTAATNMAVCGTTSACSSGTEILSGLTTGNVQITHTGNDTVPTTITVAIVGFNYQPVFDLSRWTGGAAWADVAAAPSTTMRYMIWR